MPFIWQAQGGVFMALKLKLSLMFVTMLFIATVEAKAPNYADVNGSFINEQDLNGALASFTESQRYNLLKDKASKKQIVENLVDQNLP